MQPAPIPVLFTHFGDPWLRGSERLLLDLVTHLDPARVRPIVWCNGAAMAEASEAAGIATIRSPFAYYLDHDSPRPDPGRYAAMIREGIGLVRAHGIRVLHANSAAPSQWMQPVARATRLPLLAHLHIDYLRRARYACLLHHATLLVGVSHQVVADFIRDGMAQERTRVIYNGVDRARFAVPPGSDLRAELGIPAGAVVVAAIGSLIRRKGHDVVLRAVALLPAPLDVRLLLVSDGPERGTLERLADELGLAGRVHFLGHRDDVSGVFRATDIVALASRGDAFGLVLAEAGFCSLPVVATAVGGIPEVVEAGETGLLVPLDDVQAFADALARLAADPALRRTLGEAAHRRCERLFSVEAMAASFQSTYEELAGLPRARLGWSGLRTSLAPYRRLLGRARTAA